MLQCVCVETSHWIFYKNILIYTDLEVKRAGEGNRRGLKGCRITLSHTACLHSQTLKHGTLTLSYTRQCSVFLISQCPLLKGEVLRGAAEVSNEAPAASLPTRESQTSIYSHLSTRALYYITKYNICHIRIGKNHHPIGGRLICEWEYR